MSSNFESPVPANTAKTKRQEDLLQKKLERNSKRTQFIDDMARRHADARISYEEFRQAAKPVFGFYDDAPYRKLWVSFRRRRLLEELAMLYPTSPCTFGEFQVAAAPEEWAEPTQREVFKLFRKKMVEHWKGAKASRETFLKVTGPYSDLLQVLEEATGFRSAQVVHCLIAHYASLILSQRVDLVDSFVTANTMSVEEMALVRKLLENMDISDDPRILGRHSQRIAKRRRRHILGSVFGG